MYPAISLDLLFYILFTSVRSSSKVLWVYVPLVVSFFILCPIISLIHTSFAPALFISEAKVCLPSWGRSEGDYGRGLEDAEGDAEEAAVDT